jgi:hypothetical protein
MEFPEQPFVRSDFPDDAIDVYEVALDKDSLILSVRHSGGCKVHEYRLIASNYWLESNPVQLDAVLAHRDPDDPCDAIVSECLAFGLSALRASYFESYGPNGDAIINVHDGTGDPHSIRYEFSGAVTLQKALK